MSVKEVMTASPLTVSPEDSLATAAERMWNGDCGVLPVVNEDGVVVAMITDRDVCMAAWSRNRSPAELRVVDAMSRALVACRPEDAVETAEAAMRTSQVRRLPVVDEAHHLLGVISLADIALANEHAQRGQRAAAVNGLSTTLAVICSKPLPASRSGAAAASSGEPAGSSPPPASEGTPATANTQQEPKDGEAA